MPITDPSLPVRFLEVLETTGSSFVVLHREAEIGEDSLDSDLDISVELQSDEVLQKGAEGLKNAGLSPVIRWPYDIGGAVTFFMSTPQGEHGMQADLLHDPRGQGRYGIRTGEIQKRSVMGRRYPVPDPLDEGLYLMHKRWCKGQTSAFGLELDKLREETNITVATKRAHELFSSRAAHTIQLLLEGGSPRNSNVRFRIRHLPRQVRRASSPIGFWVELVAPDSEGRRLIAALRSRFEGWVIHLGSGTRPSGPTGYQWWIRRVMPIRLRPGIFLSHSEARAHPSADLTLDWHPKLTVESIAGTVVEAMSARVVP